MTPAPLLLPNFGAEEREYSNGAQKAGARLHPILREAAWLWSLLFGESATSLGEPTGAWPDLLGMRPDGPAFPWLESRPGRGVAWLSTKTAWDELRGAGAAPAMPAPEIVRRVHDKAFAQEVASELGLSPGCLEGLIRILEPLELRTGVAVEKIAEWIASLPPWVRGSWTIKPRLGSSGRGRLGAGQSAERTMALGTAPGRALPFGNGALARLERRGGAVLEPWLERHVDLSTQLHVAPSGEVEILGTTRQVITPSGVYLGSRGRIEDGEIVVGSGFEQELRGAAVKLGRAAARAGYFGPCGVDAFSFRGPDDAEVLRPIVELNARFTMGTIALGLLRRARAAGVLEGRHRAWLFSLRGLADVRREGLDFVPLGALSSLALAESEEAIDELLQSGGVA
ncbi:hypothetical protein [Vulgatibacter incomptus]|uniref:ATP-grasp domain-containing protein n=1 Tax=Vulgatibacter incomptus TaxID=1391653 RepID=A0A0K1PAF6_9BACT|nr:hypothetical protein [Vulgatibacter incomptus]AKU90500.1 hypothetical protein AKJ08_0887 [Vulgatibacter incomptus]